MAGEVTNFPVQGGTEAVSLSNTQYRVWKDLAWLQDLRENWPEIWSKGGNVLGNLQYQRLLPVVMRESGDPDTPTEEKAIRLREAWAARHYGDFRLAGVVAQLKWFVVGRRGAGHMRNVIEAEKRRIEAARERGMDWWKRAAEGSDTTAARHDLIRELLDAESPVDVVRVLLAGAAGIAADAGAQGDEAMATLSAALGDLVDALPATEDGGEDAPAEDAQEDGVMPEDAPAEGEDPPVDAPMEDGAPDEDAGDMGKGWGDFFDSSPIPGWAQKEAAKGLTRRAPLGTTLVVDGEKRMMVATSSDVDRYSDIVDVKTVQIDAWKRNPVLLYGHNSNDPENHIGSAAGIAKKTVKGSDGKSREAVVFEPEFDMGGEPGVDANMRARLVARQFKDGMVKTCSIGFIPDWSQSVRRCDLPEGDPMAGPRGILFRNAQIIECSILPIPANPAAEVVGS